jgi:hypothetical protein
MKKKNEKKERGRVKRRRREGMLGKIRKQEEGRQRH